MITGFGSSLLAMLPLALDTFTIAAVVGASRPTGWTRARVSAIFVLFEAGMPLLGLALGASLGQAVGAIAEYLSGGLLIILAGYLRWADNDDDGADGEAAKARRLMTAHGLALLGLGLSISLDELAIGFSLGLGVHHSATPTQVATIIAIQTLLVSQLALSLGRWVSLRLRERLEALISPGLAVLGGYQLTGQLIHTGQLTPLTSALLTVVGLIPAIVIAYHARRHTPPATSPQAPSELPQAPHLGDLISPAPRAATAHAGSIREGRPRLVDRRGPAREGLEPIV